MKKEISGFVAFLKQYGVVGLAIAVIIGGKLNELISSLVNDLLMPVVFRPALQLAQIDDVKKLQFHGVLYGKVIGAALDFLIVAVVVYVFARLVFKEDVVAKK